MIKSILMSVVALSIASLGHADSTQRVRKLRQTTPAIHHATLAEMEKDIRDLYDIQSQFGEMSGSRDSNGWLSKLGQEIEIAQQLEEAVFTEDSRATLQEIDDAASSVSQMKLEAQEALKATNPE